MMRITNSIMMTNTKTNINNNKVSVDRLNTQMSTQKKITKPSDNPLIAIRSLRLSNTLSEINQYYKNNIKDAQSWMSVTETALTNMKNIFKDAYRLCVNGATGTLTDEDRNTMLTQLKGLSGQLYAEANADYAERTVFSGYKTNSTVAFTNEHEAMMAKYQILERLDFTDIKSKNYYANTFDTPSASTIPSETDTLNLEATPGELSLKRIRLSYDQLSDLDQFSYSCAADTTSTRTDGSTSGTATVLTDADTLESSFQWRTQAKDSAFTYTANPDGSMQDAVFEDVSGHKLTIDTLGNVQTEGLEQQVRTIRNGGTETAYIDANGDTIFTVRVEKDAGGNRAGTTIVDQQGNVAMLNFTAGTFDSITDAQGNTISPLTAGGTVTVKNADGNPVVDATTDGTTYTLKAYDKPLIAGGYVETSLKIKKMTNAEFKDHLSKLADGSYSQAQLDEFDNTVIYLPDTGEMVMGSKLAENLTTERANLEITYNKNGFKKGETRPEMYFNCTNKTALSPANHITYENFDADGNWIHQDINYAISANQDMTINTQIHDVVSADSYRDLAEMTQAVQAAVDAHTTVGNLETMIKSGDYPNAKAQTYLKDCLEKAKKQMAYADDYLQKYFGSQITNFEAYSSKVNLAITDVGARGDQVALAENRMSNQKLTFTELKSNNEDEELSDVTIDYTSAYSAYQASLQAAGKIENMSLLDYL